MEVSLRTISGVTYKQAVEPTTTIAELKALVSEKANVAPEGIKLIYSAKFLDDAKTIAESNIQPGQAIIMHIQSSKNAKQPVKKSSEKRKSPKKESPIKVQEAASPSPIQPKEENAQKPEQPGHSVVAPLPELETKHQLVDPPNFNALVQTLTEMGFSEGDAAHALRAAVYNPDRAAEFLLANYIPEMPQLYDPNDLPNEEEEYEGDSDEEDNEQASTLQFLRQLHQNPELLPIYLKDLADNNPAVAPLIRNDPASFLVSLGVNPSEFDLSALKHKSEFETLMEKFTEEEQKAIHRLEKLGFDTTDVIQVFEACDRDENLTKSCLEQMK